MTIETSYLILDPRLDAVRAPYTFFLPSSSEIAAVSEGDFVKLMFQYTHDIEKWSIERMWVMVEEVEGGSIRGYLDNDPFEPSSKLMAGDTIFFERRNIIAILWSRPELAPQTNDDREYWDRCLVDQCVLDGIEPVEFVYREEPDMASEGDKHPDSGWRVRGRMGNATDEEAEAREIAYVPLGVVLNRDDSWLHLIDEPVGTRMMRDFNTGKYLPEARI